MAKPWANQFYHSAAWRRLRKQVLTRDIYTCHDCGGYATEVHHIVDLTPGNISNPRVSLNPDNLMCLCHDCHTRRTLGAGDVPDGYSFDETGQLVEERVGTPPYYA